MNYRDKVFGEELKGEQLNESIFVSCRFPGAKLKFSAFMQWGFRKTI